MKIVIGLLLTVSSSFAFASNSGVTYQGRIVKPDGSPLAGQFTQFKMQIRTPDAQGCLMYEEVQSQDLRNTSGSFSLTINDGNGSRTDTSGLTLDRIFANRGSYALDVSTCASGSGVWVPNVSDGRNLVVLFKDETMTSWEPIPAQKINFVPYAFESKQIAGFTADSLLRVVNGSGDPITGLAPLSNAQYTELMSLLNGTSTRYSQLNGTTVPAMSTGEVLGWNGSAWVSQSVVGGANSVTTTMLQSNSVDSSKIATGAVGTSQIASNVSVSTSGTLASAITTTRDFKIYAASPSTFYVGMLAPPTLAASYSLTWPLNAGATGQVLTTDGSGALTWTTPAGTGISALTGDVTATGSGSVAATVVSVGGSTATQVHSGELLANAATSANTASAIVKRDGSGNFAANTGTFNGIALNNAGSVVNLVNPTGAAYTMTLPTGAGASGQVLTTNGSGVTSWTNPLSSSSAFIQGGNNFGAIAVLGTNDAFDFRFRTNGATAMTVTADGNVGIGTTSPVGALDVRAGSAGAGNDGAPLNFYAQNAGTGNKNGGDINLIPGSGSGSGYGGVVNINTTTPLGWLNKGLNVNGAVNVTGGVWSDNPFIANGGSSSFSFANNTRMTSPGTENLALTTNNVEHFRLTSTGNVGIGTTSPTTKLEVAGSFRVGDGGETCGASLTGAIRYNGGNLQFCNGTPPWTTLGVAGTGMTSLTGDVTATGPGASAATVVQVGGYSAANVAAGATLANAATTLNSASTIVKRDGSGNFAAGSISAGNVVLRDSGSNTVSLQAPSTVASSYVMKLPTGIAAANGQVLTSDTSGNLSWTTMSGAPTGAAGGDLSGTYPNPGVAMVGTSSAANVHAAELLANAATAANTVSTIIKRDGSGNFTATDVSTSSVKADTLKLNNAGSIVNVVNPIGAAYTLTLPTGTGASGQVLSTNGSGVTSWIAAATGSQWTTQAPGINYMSGNVGIGTTSATALLEVNGRVAFGGANANIDSLASPDLTPLQNSGKTWVGWNRIGGQGETDFVANRGPGVGGGFGFWDYSNTGVMTQLMYMNGSNGRVGVNTTSAGSTFSVNGGASIGSYHMTASPANGLIVSGNVGIGTTAPSGIFEVQGGTNGSGGGTPIIMQAQSANQFAYAMGGGVDIRAGAGNYGGHGGDTTLAGGFPGGAANLLGGSAYNGQTGGAVNIIAGDGNAGPIGADVNITSGLGNYNSSAGHVRINGGYSYNGGNGNGGSIIMTAGAGQGTGTGGNFQFLSGNVGIGTSVPATALDVKGGIRAGSETEVNITCNSANEGIQRYNRTNHFMEYCNGTSWMQPLVQAVGSTANVTASGPPVSANVYTISSASADFTPSQGSVAATHNGVWPANGASVAGCIDMPVSGGGSLIYDLGSNKSVGNVYFSSTGYSNTYDFAFSTDGVTFVSSSMIGGGYDGYAKYQTSGLAPAQTARYIRIRYTNGSGSFPYWCQVAFGP